MTLRDKAISGFKWSFIGTTFSYLIQFVVGIILARMLIPSQFGLVGIMSVFLIISRTLVDSGFGNSLIRKKNCTNADYSTVFIFNIIVGLFLYIILFFSSGYISNFYNEPELNLLTKVLGLDILISSITIVQRNILIRRLRFKIQTQIILVASIISGIVSIYLAYKGFGVWSLVIKILLNDAIQSSMLWYYSKWSPTLEFNKDSFKEMFSFGGKLLLSGVVDRIYQNIYYLIIGKVFSPTQLGYYTRADLFRNLPSVNLTTILQSVSYPVLSKLQDDPQKLKSGYKKLTIASTFISFILMIGMASVAKPLVLSLIGEKWLPCVPYLQLLCFSGMFYPLHSINVNMLKVKGRSDLFLRLEIIKKSIALPIIVTSVFFGIEIMLISMIFTSLIALFINSYWSKILVSYSIKEQIIDVLPSLFTALFMGLVVYGLSFLISGNVTSQLIVLVLIGFVIVVLISEIFKLNGYVEIKSVIFNELKLKRNPNE